MVTAFQADTFQNDAFQIDTGTNAAAGNAAGTGAAGNLAVSLDASGGVASGTGTSHDATIEIGTRAAAELASGAGAAYVASESVAPSIGSGAGTGTAHDPTVLQGTTADAGVASGTGAASAGNVSVASRGGLASATGLAANAGVTAVSGGRRRGIIGRHLRASGVWGGSAAVSSGPPPPSGMLIADEIADAVDWGISAVSIYGTISHGDLTSGVDDPYQIASGDHSGWAMFTLSGTTDVVLDTIGSQGDAVIYLYGPGTPTNDNWIDNQDDNIADGTNPHGNSEQISQTLAAGTYYVAVIPFDAFSSSFVIKLNMVTV